MLSLSDCTIRFAKSSSYFRLLLVLYTISSVLLYNSICPHWLQIGIVFYFLVHLAQIRTNPSPHPHYLGLHYRQDHWILEDKQGRELPFEKIKVLLNAGLFYLLELKMEKKRKVLVIFSDQLSKQEFRILRVIEKIN